ncbi:hypothetical protein Ancab_036272 [Ancistrocladus abbreviatus]
MASSKVMASTNSRNSDLKRRPPSSSTKPYSMISDYNNNNNIDRKPKREDVSSEHDLGSSASMTVDGLLRDMYRENSGVGMENTLLDAEISLIDAAGAISAVSDCEGNVGDPPIPRKNSYGSSAGGVRKTVDEVWREIVAGKTERKGCKVEAPDEMMTLEDFLAKAGAVEDEDVKGLVSGVPITERLSGGGMSGGMFAFDPIGQSPCVGQTMVEGGVIGFGNGVEGMGGVARGKRRGGSVLEPLDKSAQQRQRRMIKNRESAARSRERKQAYQVELESLAVKLEEENEQLLREKFLLFAFLMQAERMKHRVKQLMEKVVPVVEKRRPARVLKRVRSMQW